MKNMHASILPVLCILFSQFSVSQEIPPTYNNKSIREAKVTELRNISIQRKQEADVWARQHNVPVRFERDNVLYELIAVVDKHPLYNITHNEDAAISSAADKVRNTIPYNVNGSGITVGVWDGGHALTTHQEFDGRVTTNDTGGSSGVHYHSTHVAGTIGASGVVSSAEGMAPRVAIDSYDWNSDEAEMASRGAAAPIDPGKIHISNHSYGSGLGWDNSGTYWPWHISVTADKWFGMYSIYSREWDEIAYNAPYYLIFKSSGNDRNDNPSNGDSVYYWNGSWVAITYSNSVHPGGDGNYKGGYDCIAHKGVAKNIMTVGAVNDAVLAGVRHLPSATISSFSSWGPADDGRIKPDVVGNGVSLYSTDSGADNDYTWLSGTSMSSPNVCGSAALLLHIYKNNHSGNHPRSSTLKGILIHTADDLGNIGPDYVFGWGLINTEAAADLIVGNASGNPSLFFDEQMLSGGTPEEELDFVIDGTEPLKATICWTDPPGAASSVHDTRTPKLVNDLDLQIHKPGGGVELPYVCDYMNPSIPAAKADNAIDNVEQVLIPAGAAPGTYTVKITHKGGLVNSPQHYSLVVTGAIPEPGIGILTAMMLLLAGIKRSEMNYG
jgi:subtilisin family serine protease